MVDRSWGRVINNTTSFITILRVLPYGPFKAALEASSAVWHADTETLGPPSGSCSRQTRQNA
jgi:hypothetical protein